MRVTPTTIRETGVMTPFGWATSPAPAEERGIADANRVLLRCGVPEAALRPR